MKLVRKDYEEWTGITEETWYDEQAKTITLRRYQDVEHTLAMNKVLFNEHASKKPTFTDVGKDNGVYLKARIPLMIIEQWFREGFDWYKATPAERKARLNDSDYSKLLVRPGKL